MSGLNSGSRLAVNLVYVSSVCICSCGGVEVVLLGSTLGSVSNYMVSLELYGQSKIVVSPEPGAVSPESWLVLNQGQS